MAKPTSEDTSSPYTTEDLIPAAKPNRPPQPFTWRCHVCSRTQRLSCGLRCLSCSHTMCLPPPDTTKNNKTPTAATTATTATTRRANNNKLAASRRGRRHCTTSFDYEPWRDHNIYRRAARKFHADPERYRARYGAWMRRWEGGDLLDRVEVEGKWVASMQRDENRRLDRMCEGRSVCEADCDYPAECVSIRAAWRSAHAHARVDEEDDGDDVREAVSKKEKRTALPTGRKGEDGD